MRATHVRGHRGPPGRGVPGPLGHQLASCGPRDQGGPAGAPSAALGSLLQILLDRGRVRGTPGMGGYQRLSSPRRVSEVLSNEVRPLGIRSPSSSRGVPHRLGRFVDAHAAVSKDYEATVGEMNRYRGAVDGQQPGDPARARDHHLRSRSWTSPPRLLLGSDALASPRIGPARAAGRRVGRGQPLGRLRGPQPSRPSRPASRFWWPQPASRLAQPILVAAAC